MAPGTGLTQGWRLAVWNSTTGVGNEGSTKFPTATPYTPGRGSMLQNTVEPHVVQKWYEMLLSSAPG